MGNIHMPTSVAFAGGALCILGGYLVGVVAGPETTGTNTALVDSYDLAEDLLCLRGESIMALAEDATSEVLCGTWQRPQRTPRSQLPAPGDEFRFVTVTTRNDEDDESATYIYGDVVR